MKLTKTAIYDVLNQLPKSVDAQKLKNQGVEAFSIDINYRPKNEEMSGIKIVYTVKDDANPVITRKVDDDTYHISVTKPIDRFYREGAEIKTLYRRNIKDLTELIYAELYKHTHNLHVMLEKNKNRSFEKQEEYYQKIISKVHTDSDYLNFLNECVERLPRDRDEHEARIEFVGNWNGYYRERFIRDNK